MAKTEKPNGSKASLASRILTFCILVFLFLLCAITPSLKPLEHVDTALLKLLNPDNELVVIDRLMSAVSGLGKNLLFWLTLFCWLCVMRGVKRSVQIMLVVLLVISLTDLLVGKLAKNLWKRPRPPAVEVGVREVAKVGSSPSFPSAHAANWFAGAKTISSFVPEGKLSLFLIALLVAYSRVYLGAHYPSDVLAGSIVGYAFASLLIYIGRLLARRMLSGDLRCALISS
jgi:undecaprenyl-diphosphatase